MQTIITSLYFIISDLIKLKTHTLDKTFSFHDIQDIIEFVDKSSRVMHKNIFKQIINKQ